MLLVLAAVGCGSPKPASESTPPPATVEHRALAIGDHAPSFRVKRIDAPGDVALPTHVVTLVAFLATWNGPAKQSIPKLEELSHRFGPRGFQVQALFVDDEPTSVKEFGATYGATFPIAWDEDKKVAAQMMPSSMPTMFILDRDGVVRFIHRGYHDGAETDLAREIESLLPTP
jgi:peroxiredoxin